MTDHHTCHPHCECQPGTEQAAALNEFVGAFQEAMAEAARRYNKNMRTAAAVIRASLPERDAPTNPAPDLARDDDAHSEVDDEDQPDGIASDSHDLPVPDRAAERVREFLSQFGDGLVPVDCVGAPLYARDLESLSRCPGAHRRDNQRHANVTQGLCEQNERMQRGLDRLRSELAEMTANRDALDALASERRSELARATQERDEWDANASEAEQRIENLERQLADMTAQHEAERGSSDIWRDRYQAAMAQMSSEYRRAEAAEAELAEVREDRRRVYVQRDALRKLVDFICPNCDKATPWTDGTETQFWCQVCGAESPIEICEPAERDTAQAEVKELREELGQARAERDGAFRRQQALNNDRDALQARIGAGISGHVADVRYIYGRNIGDFVEESIRQRLAPPADDGSEANEYGITVSEQELTKNPGNPLAAQQDSSCGVSHYGKCGPKNLDCLRRETPLPADDSSEAREHQHGQMNGCDATCAEDDAENESPPFKAGDYARDTDGYVWRVTDCHLEGFTWMVARKRGDWLSTQHASKLEPWRPLLRESVIHVGGAHDYPSMVTQVYSDGSYAVRHKADGSESVVTVDKLRPAQGGDE